MFIRVGFHAVTVEKLNKGGKSEKTQEYRKLAGAEGIEPTTYGFGDPSKLKTATKHDTL
jgi:hypothetical protein